MGQKHNRAAASKNEAIMNGEDGFILSASVPKEVSLSNDAVNEYLAKAKTYDPYDFSYTYASGATQMNMQIPPCATLSFSTDSGAECSPEKFSVEVSKNADLSEAKTYFASDDPKKIPLTNLETGTVYYYRAILELSPAEKAVSKISSFKTKPGVRFFRLGGVENARDEGGWVTQDGKTIKQGLVIRSAELGKISQEGKDFLVNDIGVKTELDLRNDADLIKEGYDPCRTESFIDPSVRYIRISSEHNAKFFVNTAPATETMRIFTDPANYPISVHCAGGADRTGAFCTAFKALLGVSENDCVADYELTNTRFRNLDDPNYSGEAWCTCTAFMKALHDLDGASFNEKVTRFFSENCGFSAMELSNIKNIMLSDSAVFLGGSLAADREEKNVFSLDLRKSGGIASVTADGIAADYFFDPETSALTVKSDFPEGKHTGKITFADGGILDFEIRKQPAAF